MTKDVERPFRELAAPTPPALTPDERVDLYLLRRHLGIEPEDAYYRRPPWAVDLMVECLRAELEARVNSTAESESPAADWEDIPEDLDVPDQIGGSR